MTNEGLKKGGNPLDLLVSWLKFGQGKDGKAAHWHKSEIMTHFTHDVSTTSRIQLYFQEGGQALFDHERNQDTDAGEGGEPLTLEGMGSFILRKT